MDSIFPALISGIVSLAVCIVNSRAQFNKIQAENEKNIAVIQRDIQNLTEKVNKHNNLVERMYKVETKLEILKSEVEDDGK